MSGSSMRITLSHTRGFGRCNGRHCEKSVKAFEARSGRGQTSTCRRRGCRALRSGAVLSGKHGAACRAVRSVRAQVH